MIKKYQFTIRDAYVEQVLGCLSSREIQKYLREDVFFKLLLEPTKLSQIIKLLD
jgi:hypothetical protein